MTKTPSELETFETHLSKRKAKPPQSYEETPLGSVETWRQQFLIEYVQHWDMTKAWETHAPPSRRGDNPTEDRMRMMLTFRSKKTQVALMWLQQHHLQDRMVQKAEALTILSDIARSNPTHLLDQNGEIDLARIAEIKPQGITKLKVTKSRTDRGESTTVDVAMTSQMDAIKRLSELNGWDSPRQVEHNHDLSMSSDLLDALDAGSDRFKDVIDAELVEDSASSDGLDDVGGWGVSGGTGRKSADPPPGESLTTPSDTDTPRPLETPRKNEQPGKNSQKISENKIPQNNPETSQPLTMEDLI